MSIEYTSQSIKIQIIFRNIINKNTNHHYRCNQSESNRSDEKTFKIIHTTKQNTAHFAAKKVSYIYFFFIISYQNIACRSHIVKPNDVYMMNGQCFANNFIVLSIRISWMEKVFVFVPHTRLAFWFLNFLYLWIAAFVYIQSISCWIEDAYSAKKKPLINSDGPFSVQWNQFKFRPSFFLFFFFPLSSINHWQMKLKSLQSVICKWINLQRVPVIITIIGLENAPSVGKSTNLEKTVWNLFFRFRTQHPRYIKNGINFIQETSTQINVCSDCWTRNDRNKMKKIKLIKWTTKNERASEIWYDCYGSSAKPRKKIASTSFVRETFVVRIQESFCLVSFVSMNIYVYCTLYIVHSYILSNSTQHQRRNKM